MSANIVNISRVRSAKIFCYPIYSLLVVFSLFLTSCEGEKPDPEKDLIKEDTEEFIAHNSVDTLSISDTLINKGHISMQEILEAFRYCKETAENDLQCKYFISKAVDDYFGVKDFKSGDTYIDFEDILFKVRSSDQWKSLGMATNQKTLEEAQHIANGGRVVLAIQTDTKYGHVVIIMPGNLEKAPSWNGLNCPKVASFFMIQDLESFVDRSIAYAWTKPEGIEIFARN